METNKATVGWEAKFWHDFQNCIERGIMGAIFDLYLCMVSQTIRMASSSFAQIVCLDAHLDPPDVAAPKPVIHAKLPEKA